MRVRRTSAPPTLWSVASGSCRCPQMWEVETPRRVDISIELTAPVGFEPGRAVMRQQECKVDFLQPPNVISLADVRQLSDV